MNKEEKRKAENCFVELNAIKEAIETVLSGGEVSDFMESFFYVRNIIDLMGEIKAVKKEYLDTP